MDQKDLDILNEDLPHMLYREDLMVPGFVTSVITNDYGTMFELDIYQVKILSLDKIPLQIGQRLTVSTYLGNYQRGDRNYQQSYLHYIVSDSYIDVYRNIFYDFWEFISGKSVDKKNQ